MLMLVRVVRDLTPEEVEEKIKEFERKFNMKFDEFEELFLEKRLNDELADIYFEWAELVDTYKGYVEDGQLDYTIEEIRNFKPEEISLLTPKRIQLLYQLANLRVESINDLARKTRRNVKNIYQDLKILSKLGFVKFRKNKGRNITPEVIAKEVIFMIR
ncbi:ArsR family transcriptional regulator [Candidatus Bathyarchaeota archaeon]|nr:MAG: ArsR family transcriptional regulator [Candidatus Bathyarchaeota archaeon]